MDYDETLAERAADHRNLRPTQRNGPLTENTASAARRLRKAAATRAKTKGTATVTLAGKKID